MGEVNNFVKREIYIQVLKKEIIELKKKYNPETEGTGHFNTAIGVLTNRVNELEGELNWPFPAKDSDWL